MFALRPLYVTLPLVLSLVAIGSAEDRINEALETGEFAIAIAEAERVPDDARDEALLQVAAAQVKSGALRPAQITLAQIRDDDMLNGAATGRFDGGAVPNGMGPAQGFTAGGGAQADFDTLIDLITTTVEPDTWEDLGGEGAIAAFAGGIYVDPNGLVKRRSQVATKASDVIIPESWRSISLPRLDKAVQLARLTGQPLPAEMRQLGGLAGVEMVLVYPETEDLVLAGPAAADPASALRLEDLAVVMHHALHEAEPFGCSIDPRRGNLAATQEFLNTTSKRSLKPGERSNWAASIERKMGRQDVNVFGLDPDTTTAAALVDADYHMKLVGLGLIETDLIPSYLELVGGDEAMNLVRWWFTLGLDHIETGPDGNIFRFTGNPVRLVSEQELADATGRRMPTGTTSDLNRQFAASFTDNFDRLAERFPTYQRLRGIFQLATVAALIKQEQLPARINWRPAALASLDMAVRTTPAVEVDTVVNHKVVNRSQIVLVASGGVRVDPTQLMGELRAASASEFAQQVDASAPPEPRSPNERWVW